MEEFEDLAEFEEPERPQIRREKGDLAYLAGTSFSIEKIHVSATVRLAHLGKTGRVSPDTKNIIDLIEPVKGFVDKRLADLIVNHPVWPWASCIKGIGMNNLPKLVGLIEAFGTWYDVGSPQIPPYVTREPEPYQVIENGVVVDKMGIWVTGIERLSLPSKLHRHSGWDVDEDGHAPKRKSGTKISYNSRLRVSSFRVGQSLVRARGIWYTGGDPKDGYSRGYAEYRRVITSMKLAAGYKIVPTPTERMCLECNISVKKKATKFCPQCGGKLSLKTEPPGILYKGHLHNMVMRHLNKDFELCLWLVWRKAEGLPISQPYNVAKLGEPAIDPWKMIDRD